MLGVLDWREVAVVKTHSRLHPGLANRRGHPSAIGRIQSDRLLDPQVLTGACHRFTNFSVHGIGRGHAHHADPRILDHRAPVQSGLDRSVLLNEGLKVARQGVRNRHERGARREIRVMVGQPCRGTGMNVSHPPGTDDPVAEGALFTHEPIPIRTGPPVRIDSCSLIMTSVLILLSAGG